MAELRRRPSQQKGFKIWDGETKEVMGRTPKSWGLVCGCFTLLYIGLAACFAICLVTAMATLPSDRPKYAYGAGQAILVSPGMGIVPQRNQGSETPVIHFDATDPDSYEQYVTEIREYLTAYDGEASRTVSHCDGSVIDADLSPCSVDTAALGDCDGQLDPTFGYASGQPCVLLRVNKIIGWEPVLFAVNPSPDELGERWEADKLTVSCKQSYKELTVERGVDHMGEVDFFPPAGFPASCFPYCGPEGDPFLTPLLMVRFQNLTRTKEVRVWCHTWAANLEPGDRSRVASAIFRIQVD